MKKTKLEMMDCPQCLGADSFFEWRQEVKAGKTIGHFICFVCRYEEVRQVTSPPPQRGIRTQFADLWKSLSTQPSFSDEELTNPAIIAKHEKIIGWLESNGCPPGAGKLPGQSNRFALDYWRLIERRSRTYCSLVDSGCRCGLFTYDKSRPLATLDLEDSEFAIRECFFHAFDTMWGWLYYPFGDHRYRLEMSNGRWHQVGCDGNRTVGVAITNGNDKTTASYLGIPTPRPDWHERIIARLGELKAQKRRETEQTAEHLLAD